MQREIRVVSAYGGAVELGPYRHFMQKEIFEQPRAISDTVPQTDAFDATLFGDAAPAAFADIDSLLILACGTSYYSGLTAKYWLESIAKIPTQVEIASEYRYRESVPNPRQLVLVISQSGETADTLAALKHAQSLGHTHTLAVCNVATSAMVRLTEMQFLTHAGTEIGVASTKAFTTQLVALFVLAATLGKLRGHVDAAQEAEFLKQLRPARRAEQRARAGAADHRVVGGIRAQGKRAVPRPRAALPDRARRRAEAEGNLVHPRRGLSGRRTGTGRSRSSRKRCRSSRSRRTTRCSRS